MSEAVHPWVNEYRARLSSGKLPLHSSSHSIDFSTLYQLWHSQLCSRLLDLQSRLLQAKGQSFYTIGSAGHEGNAAVAAALRLTDPAFLHYRSGAFFVERSKQLPGSTPLYDMLLSFCASSDDPISGGRHKVLGSLALNIPPQTSTIASQLPKAVGAAFAIDLSKRLGLTGQWPTDAIVLCSFGDASANHSTAQGAINSACWAAYQQVPVPVLFVCEDNGLGISTPTPSGWIEQDLADRPALKYFAADSRDLAQSYHVARRAADYVRSKRKPAVLHLSTVRLFGHAGADAEAAYRTKAQIEAELELDPLLSSTAALLASGEVSAEQLLAQLNTLVAQISRVAAIASSRPKLTNAAQVMASIAPVRDAQAIPAVPNAEARQQLLAFDQHNMGKKQHLAKLLNWALHDVLAQYHNTVVFGEDVGKKGGVYGVTQHLVHAFGSNRVINTLLDEQSILGMAIGLAQQGFIAIPEIQFLAYVHNAEDQIRGEAATLPFFSNGQYHNAMVIRIAGLAYQRGFGGHFHNDNSFAVFRDIPGVILLCPSNGYDAALLLRQAVALAHQQKRLVILLEPIALYMTRDLVSTGDALWCHDYPPPDTPLPALGEPAVYGDGDELAIISYGNGYYLSRQAELELAAQGYQLRVLDLRTLVPLHTDLIIKALTGCRKVLIVDECRRRGSLSEELFTALHEAKPGHFSISRLCAEDSFVPLGAAAYAVLPSKQQIVQQALSLLTVATEQVML
ncbi:dehydrogenase E1 component subunit alpha/beta [Rheinheimera nanhaiensis]|uniref:3-methyl-2-oxobutanoate dehydrogenase (2-methylpropanoyl-transferring) n=1 Tax=Rheinheimera nanhaiensis E407-8 TaxID=562729 RepID=I1E0J6_9GAMM|nr:alpha-ketoacid dehydrogenase subunit alpha/beta [Rheinheimera nanhaiensis]GAB59824.1 oxoisovalerate dehydrogenase subunits alpha/beta [Rheinheimera nanhaiensis E407-8]